MGGNISTVTGEEGRKGPEVMFSVTAYAAKLETLL